MEAVPEQEFKQSVRGVWAVSVSILKSTRFPSYWFIDGESEAESVKWYAFQWKVLFLW